MLEHQIIVLRGVSHDKSLFRKELIKSMAWLNSEDQVNLLQWVCKYYQDKHPEILKEVLDPGLGRAQSHRKTPEHPTSD